VSLDLLARYWQQLLDGLIVTMELVLVSVVLGGLLAIPVAAARLSRNRIVSGIAFGYVYFFRGTPILAQLFLVYYGAGQFRPALDAIGLWGFFRDAFTCAIFTFTLNTAAYQAEIYRGAIRAVPRGQWEAARALGLPRLPLLWKIVFPQAAVVALRPLGNEVILLIKASAVASIVTVLDLMGETRRAFSRSYDMAIYFYAAILYLALVETIRRLWSWMEGRLTQHLRHEAETRRARPADLAPAAH
jgi:polar amino acid transport system permease protein